MINSYTIEPVKDGDWRQIAELIARGIPNVIIIKLGRNFAAKFYKKVSSQDFSCAYAAYDSLDNITGVIIGSLDHSRAYSAAIKTQLFKLLFAANFRLFSWSIISWLIKGILARLKGESRADKSLAKARLIAIYVKPEARGTGLANSLVERMEEFMLSKNLAAPYCILTEKSNLLANRFYEKIRAELVRTNIHHGREINEWHKLINPKLNNEK